MKVVDLCGASSSVCKSLQRQVAAVLKVSSACLRTCRCYGITIKDNKFCLVMKKYDQSLAQVIAANDTIQGTVVFCIVVF